MLVISEDNATAWRVLANHGSEFQNLLKIDGDYQSVILRTVAAGTMSNVPILLMQNLSPIIEALSKTIEINHRTILNDITSKLPLSSTENSPLPIEVMDDEMEQESAADASLRRLKDELPTELEQEVKYVGYLLLAQRIAAEVLSNICASDDEEMAEDIEDVSEAESVQDYDITQQQQNGNQLHADKIPVEISEAIKSLGIVEKLWARAQPLAENVQQILSENGRNLMSRVNSLRVSSLLCLQNLCNCLSIEELGGATAVYNVWLDLGQQVFQTKQDFALVEASTSLMRATLEHLKKSPELFKQMTESDLQLILDGVHSCEKAEIRANWLRMLGTLGCLLMEPLVKKITEFILEATIREQDVWTISESLDSFMDMFSENDWNQIVHDLSVIAKSRELEKILKTKVSRKAINLCNYLTNN